MVKGVNAETAKKVEETLNSWLEMLGLFLKGESQNMHEAIFDNPSTLPKGLIEDGN